MCSSDLNGVDTVSSSRDDSQESADPMELDERGGQGEDDEPNKPRPILKRLRSRDVYHIVAKNVRFSNKVSTVHHLSGQIKHHKVKISRLRGRKRSKDSRVANMMLILCGSKPSPRILSGLELCQLAI